MVQQWEGVCLAGDPAHLLDGGDVEVRRELLRVGEHEVGAQRQVDPTIFASKRG
jgi:hypothetical protein